MEPVALYTRRDSIYKKLGLECYDIDRDARTYPGIAPVIAHPPCRAWANLRGLAKPRKDEPFLALHAVDMVRMYGGVLEHPAGSRLWPEVLPLPGSRFDAWGGWSLSIDQSWWGHPCRKRTFLYIKGIAPSRIPAHPIGGVITRTDENISKADREHTPIALAEWLIELCQRIPSQH